MTRTSLTGAAALALALLASAPAMADCRPAMPTDVRGDHGYYDTRVGNCAYWAIYGRGDRQATTGQVIGYDARVLTANRGYGARSHVDSIGDGARIVTQMRSGATGRVFNRGANEIVMRGANGSFSDVRVVGNGTYVRSEFFR
jgi:hypothetical protein